MSAFGNDIWRAARLLDHQYGDVASDIASQKAGELLEVGDADGAFVWTCVAAAIDEWKRQIPRDNEVN